MHNKKTLLIQMQIVLHEILTNKLFISLLEEKIAEEH